MDYDVIIIGIGPAGLSAGIYAARRKLKTLVIGEKLGGQMAYAHVVENYPGIKTVSGMELGEIMKSQATDSGCEVVNDTVISFDISGETKKVKTQSKEYTSKTVIIATGMQHRKLGAEGEDKFIGKGVSYCATCDGPLFKGKTVAVVGGSDSAVKSALYLKDVASKVILVHRKDSLRAEEENQRLLKESDVEVVWSSVVEKIDGDAKVSKIILKDVNTEETCDLDVDGVFIEIGEVPTTQLVKAAGVDITENNYIKVNSDMETNIPGVYSAGDVTGSLAQIITAASGGAVAAMSAYLFIKGGFYGEKKPLDYGAKK
ncbi:MAG: thioredoxin-disulfide reductase [Candidatus Aenigmarchaeota archaeon]|nr:thioredoxin-disulfide reductase [Candidatus Aenigmarchaeota archaeon]